MNKYVVFSIFLAALYPPIVANSQISADSISAITRVDDEYPSWSPDGKKIAFQSNRQSKNFQLYVMDSDGKNLRRITFNNNEDETPVWSPDSSRILFSRYTEGDNNEMFFINPEGTGEIQLTDHPLRDGHAKFSRDGNTIIFNAQRHDDGTHELKNYEIYTTPMPKSGEVIEANKMTRLTDWPEWDTYPSLSPDGQKVLWRRILPDTTAPRKYNSEIFIMNRDGSEIKNLSKSKYFDGYPEWSPDGSHIVFASNRHGVARFHLQLFVMKADGSEIRQITNNEPDEEDVRPAWSPDGKRIVFNRVGPTGTQIHIMEVNTTLITSSFNEVVSGPTALSGGSSRGLAWGDLNGDGFPELIVANTMNNSNYLFRNNEGRLQLDTEDSSTTSAGWTEAVNLIDYDNDGDLDLFYVTQWGDPNQLFQNDGKGQFTEVEAGDLTELSSSSPTACWCDFDLDGDLDVYLVERDGANDRLFENNGEGMFNLVTNNRFPYQGGDGRSCAWGDIDGDGFAELFVGNNIDKSMAKPTKAHNFFYKNQRGRQFEVIEDSPVTALRNQSYGASFADVDQDNDLDLFVTNISRTDQNQLFLNDGKGNLSEAKNALTQGPSKPSKGHTWGDFDNDGDLDCYVANGTENIDPELIINDLYLSDGQGDFKRVEVGTIATTPTTSAGISWGDMDRDGDLDLYLANWGKNTEANFLYRNDLYGTNWLEIGLQGKLSNSYGIGAKVRLKVQINGEEQWLTRWLLPQTGYSSQNEPIIHFGLGDASSIEELEVTWPSGNVQHIFEVEMNQFLKIVESDD